MDDFEFDIDVSACDFEVDVNLDDFTIDTTFTDSAETRYIKPKLAPLLKDHMVMYEYAQDLVDRMDITKDCRYFAVVSGNFIFGDFLEALIVDNGWRCKNLTISTLSVSQENIDSLKNLIDGKDIDQLNLIVSSYFFSHERHDLVKYAYEQLDVDNRFQLAVAGTHCKTALIETYCGKYIVIHGSANLRSSRCLEQFELEESKELYDFHNQYHCAILESYATIKKDLRAKKLWVKVDSQKKANDQQKNKPGQASETSEQKIGELFDTSCSDPSKKGN